ncbi:MAG: CRISPR-associated endonuclease Cas1 [Chloroflexi bacterium]|nr:CRISPR-associated endonuclease Cas1 [Chloroflexota bacterium]
MTTDDTFLNVPDCVPARMVNEYAYCPRLAYLEWVQGEFMDSADTVEGRFRHRVVDQEKGSLPAAAAAPAPDTESAGEPGADETIHARSVWLSAVEESLTARIDLLEGAAGEVTPVDYKRGAAPTGCLPEGAWETDCVQLCAQGLVLRANGFTTGGGVLYYVESKTRVDVPFDDALVAHTRELTRAARHMAEGARIPAPLADSPKCVRCSLAPICLPDEVNLLAGGDTAASDSDERVRRLMPARDDALPLYVQEQGARVGKSGEVFEAWLKDRKLGETRMFETSHIALLGSVQITTQAVSEALDRGIPVAYFSMGGWFKGLTHGPAHRNIVLRMAQYRAAFDPVRSLALARGFVAAKIRNTRTMLMRNHAALNEEIPVTLAQLAQESLAAGGEVTLLSIEAQAAKAYFGAFSGMLKVRGAEADWPFDFNGRNRRPPRDAVNALLSFAYSLLAKDFTVLAQVIGFDPYLGFYHHPRYGRPSLALDMMEEFRPLVADSVVLTVINTGVLVAKDFVQRGPAIMLTPGGRRKFLQAYEARLDTLITHPVFGYRISYRRVLEVQLRLLGRVLTGELDEYPGFVTR